MKHLKFFENFNNKLSIEYLNQEFPIYSDEYYLSNFDIQRFYVMIDDKPSYYTKLAGFNDTKNAIYRILKERGMISDERIDVPLIKQYLRSVLTQKHFESTNSFDYDYILKILRKNFGWGNGCFNYFDEFENSQEYFLNPQDSNDYANQFHIFMTDLNTGKLRGTFNKVPSGLRPGKWRMSIPVYNPTSIHNKLT